MPREHFAAGHPFLPRSELLSFEEIARFSRIAAGLGVQKLRLTGGEPLLRTELPVLVAMLSRIEGLDLALTSNGSLLGRQAQALADAGLGRVTVSLDALDPVVFRQVTDAEYDVSDVLSGIEAAARAGLGPVKINVVVRRGLNDQEIVPLARHFRGSGHTVRFIEYMDVGGTNGWHPDQVLGGSEILKRLSEAFPLEPLGPSYRGEVARRHRYLDGGGEVGIITSVTQPFCGDCTRLRLSSEGKLYTCLFATVGHDVRELLRVSADDAEIAALLGRVWSAREDRYSERRASQPKRLPTIEMSYIGG